MAAKTLNISLPSDLRDLVVREVEAGRYGSVSEYIREAVRASLRRSTIERLALEGLASGSVEATPAFWRSLHARARKAGKAARRR